MLTSDRGAHISGALAEIAETVAAGQDPSPAQFFLYYQQRVSPLRARLAAAQAEQDELADTQYAAAICLMSLDLPQ